MTFPRRSITAVFICFALAPAAHAWGQLGHSVVADLAQHHLSPAAEAEVERLLAPEHTKSLADIASWADQVRDDPTQGDLGKQTQPLHYINFKSGDCNYTPPRDCKDGKCVVAGIDHYVTILSDKSQPDASRLQALKFVVHFVGDVHQPLHAGSRDDKGGNDYQVQFNGKGTNLHSLWDSGMLYDRHLSDDDYLAQLLQLPATPATTPVLPPDAVAWAQASCRVAIAPGVYPAKHVLPEGYVAQYRPMAEAALRQAGDRLAAILNAALDTP